MAIPPQLIGMLASAAASKGGGGDDKKEKKKGLATGFLTGEEGMVINTQEGPRNYMKEFTEKDKESRKERRGKGHMELYGDYYELTGDALDYYNASIQRMKELYENDTNHPYHKIKFNEKGKFIKDRKQESDVEQGLSFEDWLKSYTGQYYNYGALEHSYYADRKDLSATKTRRRGKQKTITRTTDPKDKENYIQYIMNSDDPSQQLYMSGHDFYYNRPKPKYSGNPEKLFRWIKKADRGNPKFKINE